jgi:hypothetical protein
MLEVGTNDSIEHEAAEPMIRAQLEHLVQDEVFRSSKRSVAFLRYIVEQTLGGSGESIKERTIGVEVFGRKPSYDTNLDHVVRTAATELRKRLAIYYGDERHRCELRIFLSPGSYVPKFALPTKTLHSVTEANPLQELTEASAPTAPSEASPQPSTATPASRLRTQVWRYVVFAVLAIAGGLSVYRWTHRPGAEQLFWKPILDSPGAVLIAVGDVPDGPPVPSSAVGQEDSSVPVLRPDVSQSVPFADTVTIARVTGALESRGKRVVIRRENSRSFSDLREGPVVLIGAFNNEWSLRLTRHLRYSLALDAERHLIYIKDAKNPASRSWSWGTDQPPERVGGASQGATRQDYALISRIRTSETGHPVVVVGGLYAYGTEAAGEFLTDPQLMQAVAKISKMDREQQNLQIVLRTTITDATPGPPELLAVSME